MFYREYRPKRFSELIGSEHIVSVLTSSLAKGNPAHAFFFTGTRGVGKTTTARLLAKSLNCTNPQLNVSSKVLFEPCGECDSCKAMESGRHLDLIEIDAASNRGIDNIREITDKVMLSPAMGKNKIYIVDEVHMLTTEASNALLKTLEEPPTHVYFILCTTNPEKVLDTIKSRCQQYVFKRPDKEQIKSKLIRILEDQGQSGIAIEHVEHIAITAKGAYRDAETLLEQYLSSGEDDRGVYGFDSHDFNLFIKHLHEGDRKAALEFVNSALVAELNFESWVEKLIQYLRALLLAKSGFNASLDDYQINEDGLNLIKSLNQNEIKNFIVTFSKRLEDFRYVNIPALPIEVSIVELTSDQIVDSKILENPEKGNGDSQTSSTQGDLSVVEKSTNKVVKNVSDKKIPEGKKTLPVNEDVIKPLPAKSKPESRQEKKVVLKEFPYKALVESLKESNHSIYLLLGSCRFLGFDGQSISLGAPYSFHKERLMSNKIRTIIENVSAELVGAQVVLSCDLLSKNEEALNLTDHNVKMPNKDVPLEKIFEEVFGDDVTSS